MTDPDPLPATMSLPAFRELALQRLGAFPYTTIGEGSGLRRAAVVLCVADLGGMPCVIVIRRAYRGRNAGQWALPGGRLEDGETPVQAALRELHEETGLTVDPGDVLGRLDDFPAASGFAITPVVVAVMDAGRMRPNPAEVHSIHPVELSRLAAQDTPRWVPQPDGSRLLQMRLSSSMVIHAPTGAMLWQFREVVLIGHGGSRTRVADFLQPDWTYR